MNFERAFLPATLLKTKRTPLQNLMGFSSTLSNSSTIIRLQSCYKSPWIVAISTSGVAYPRVNVYFLCGIFYGLSVRKMIYGLVGFYNLCWLVVEPLWKMMEFVNWDDDIPNYLESHKIPGVENHMFPKETTPLCHFRINLHQFWPPGGGKNSPDSWSFGCLRGSRKSIRFEVVFLGI